MNHNLQPEAVTSHGQVAGNRIDALTRDVLARLPEPGPQLVTPLTQPRVGEQSSESRPLRFHSADDVMKRVIKKLDLSADSAGSHSGEPGAALAGVGSGNIRAALAGCRYALTLLRAADTNLQGAPYGIGTRLRCATLDVEMAITQLERQGGGQ